MGDFHAGIQASTGPSFYDGDGSGGGEFAGFWIRAGAILIDSVAPWNGYIMVAFTEEKTALHDLICRTRVVHGRPERAVAPA